MSTPTTATRTVSADGVEVFYREAGKPEAPVVLLLHGFPTSSFQYRNLITKLAVKYRVIAPDLPGYGFTVIPDSRKYVYTFDNLATTIEKFTYALKLNKFAIYIFDYGAPTGFRLALARPDAITAIISQNGNAFNEGFGDFWNVIKAYWADPTSKEKRDALNFLVTPETTKSQYTTGEADPAAIAPETYTLDSALLARPGNADIQLDIMLDYRNNVPLYPSWQQYLKNDGPPVFAIWGKNDFIFIEPGAHAFKTLLRDKAEVKLVDGGHFPLENHLEEISREILRFLGEKGI